MHRLQDRSSVEAETVGYIFGVDVEDNAEGEVDDVGHPDEDGRIFGVASGDVAGADDDVEVVALCPHGGEVRALWEPSASIREGICRGPGRCRCEWRRRTGSPPERRTWRTPFSAQIPRVSSMWISVSRMRIS